MRFADWLLDDGGRFLAWAGGVLTGTVMMVLLYLAVGPFFYPTHTEDVVAWIGPPCEKTEVAFWSEARQAHHICIPIDDIRAVFKEGEVE